MMWVACSIVVFRPVSGAVRYAGPVSKLLGQ